jgi:ketosteroid isomerase-like protein
MTELEAPIQSMIDATNREDSDAFVAAFADDAVLVDWGREFHGRERIAHWNATENVGVHSRIEVVDVEHDGDRTTVSIRVSGDGYNGGGAFVFRTRAGRIARMEITG